jgi:hypothetical protein
VTRLLAVVAPLAVLLALAPAASAGSRTVSLKLPGDGDVSVAQYRAKLGGPGAPKLSVVNGRRLGDADVVAVADRIRGRTFAVTVVAANPRSAASAAQAGAVRVRVTGVGRLTVSQIEAVHDVLIEEEDVGDQEALDAFCRSPAARNRIHAKLQARGLNRGQAGAIVTALVRFLCLRGTPDQIERAAQTLEELGLLVPECSGTVEDFEGRLDEVVVVLECDTAVEVIAIYGQQGNTGTACLGPPGSLCMSGPGCAPLPPDSNCFFHPGGFPTGTQMTFNARFQQEVPATRARSPVVNGATFESSTGELRQAFIRVHN